MTLASESGRSCALTLSKAEVSVILHCENEQTQDMFLQEMRLSGSNDFTHGRDEVTVMCGMNVCLKNSWK